MSETKNIFQEFVGKYALSKTLRFELKPVGKTLENMRNRFGYDKEMQTFLCDQKIEDAYKALKPVLDRIHEEFIIASLESDEAKQIDFGAYFDLYRNRKDTKKKSLEPEEKSLRMEFSKCFFAAAEKFKKSAGKDEKEKDIFKKSGFDVLTEAGIMEYVEKHADRFPDILSAEEIRGHLKTFSKFFTYFSGFNQNRENYYATKDEKKTAVATRIVHENLPTFCENILTFENRKSEYEAVYGDLKSSGKVLEMKDRETGEMKLCVPIVSDIFSMLYFNRSLSQKGIEAYNALIANANYLINLHGQQQHDKKNRLKTFKTLYKQIGCGRRGTFIEAIACERESDKKNVADESLESLFWKATDAGKKYFLEESGDDNIRSIRDLAQHLRDLESFEGIYWSRAAINTISGRYLANWHELQDRLVESKAFGKPNKGSDERAKIPEVVELQALFSALDEDTSAEWRRGGVTFRESIVENSDGEKGERNRRYREIIEKEPSPSRALLGMILSDMETSAEAFVCHAEEVNGLANYSDEKGRESIKSWLDSMLAAVRIAQYFDVRPDKVVKAKGAPMESELAEGLKIVLHSADADWFQFYDLTRNFLTKKPQDDAKKNKLKLNFENSTLAAGWDVNKESENFCILLRGREGKMFLAILMKENKELFQKIDKRGIKDDCKNPIFSLSEGDSSLQKMEYDLWEDASKMIPKCSTQLKSVQKYFSNPNVQENFIFPKGYKVTSGERFLAECQISREIFELNNRLYDKNDISSSFLRSGSEGDKDLKYVKKFQKGYAAKDVAGYRDALRKWIDFCKDFLSKYPKSALFSYNFRSSEEYESVDQFYADVDEGSYRLAFPEDINRPLLDDWVDEGKLYLFEIRNQDSNAGKKEGHRENLHTMYWRALFEDIENRPKLNGEAEIFYRPALPKEKLETTRNKRGESIIKNFRFSKEKFAFHVPITLNFCRKDFAINRQMTERLKLNEDVLFLGIDRGEKHLAYYSLVDSEGRLIEQGSFNEIGGKDYNALLEARAGDRDAARKNWQTIGTIKELKNGYISQVVRKIVDIAVSRGAFIVLENLSIGFKRGRQKIEKSVYQKLELALAKKLNFLVDKSAKPGEIGSVTRALQLTPPVNTFGDIKSNQFGIMFYVRANYTSQTDPLTGWRKTIYLKGGSDKDIRKEIQGAFEDIRFDGKDYVFDYVETIGKEKTPLKRWSLYSGIEGKSLDRFRGKNISGKWEVEKYDVAKILGALFSEYDKERSIRAQMEEGKSLKKIVDDPRIEKYSAYEQLRFAIDLIQQIRNTGKDGDERDSDFLQSPVRSANGEHLDSRIVADKERQGEAISLPVSGDANGAYNIARKGILMAEHICRDGYKVYISDDEWAVWLDSREKWIEWMRKNEKDLKRKEKDDK